MRKILLFYIEIIKDLYFLRSFLVGCIIFAIYLYLHFHNQGEKIVTIIGFMTILWGVGALFFFPFSKYFCDNLIDFILGSNIIFIPLLFSLLIKFLINLFLFVGSPIIGPLVLLYAAINHDTSDTD